MRRQRSSSRRGRQLSSSNDHLDSGMARSRSTDTAFSDKSHSPNKVFLASESSRHDVLFADLFEDLQAALAQESKHLQGVLSKQVDAQTRRHQDLILRCMEAVHSRVSLGLPASNGGDPGAARSRSHSPKSKEGKEKQEKRKRVLSLFAEEEYAEVEAEQPEVCSRTSFGDVEVPAERLALGPRKESFISVGTPEEEVWRITSSLTEESGCASTTTVVAAEEAGLHVHVPQRAEAPLSAALVRLGPVSGSLGGDPGEALQAQLDRCEAHGVSTRQTLLRLEELLQERSEPWGSPKMPAVMPAAVLPGPPLWQSSCSSMSRGSESEESPRERSTSPMGRTRTGDERSIKRGVKMSNWQLQSEHGSKFAQHLYLRYARQIEWWAGLEEPPRDSFLARFVRSNFFETIAASVIILNLVFLCYSTNLEVQLQEPGAWENMVESLFILFFTVECAIRITVSRLYFFCNHDMVWNLFDLFLVLTGILELLMTSSGSAQIMRPLRTFKLAKILRGARLMRFFSELSVMLNSLTGSIATLFWSFVMLTLLFCLFSVVLVQGVATYLMDADAANDTDELLKRFGSIQVTMLTLYKTTFGGDDWSMFFDLITETGVLNQIIFILFVSLMHIAMLNILTGIFVESALQLAQPDRDLLAMRRRRENLADAEEFASIWEDIHSESRACVDKRYITPEAFTKATSSGRLQAHLEVLGIHLKDLNAGLFFEEKKKMDVEDFTERCMELRGTATSLDLNMVLSLVRQLERVQLWQLQQTRQGSKPGLAAAAGANEAAARAECPGGAAERGPGPENLLL